MKPSIAALVTVALLTTDGCMSRAPADSIEMTQEAPRISLTVPASRLVLSFPKNGLVTAPAESRGPTANPRYLRFVDIHTGFNVSGWFEPAERYEGLEQHWQSMVRGWASAGLPPVEDVSIEKEKDWQIVVYLQPAKEQAGLRFQNLYAEHVSAGTWIEMHLSRPYSPAAKEELAAFIRSIRVSVKE